jgi:D-glycero-D-manno-heptose 1,7-bisphosphate phosphatase
MTTAKYRRAAFLDRDGVINRDSGYVGCPSDFIFLSGAITALARLHADGYLLVVVTNQSGIARGYYTEADFTAVTTYMCAELAAAGAPVTQVEHCPHLPADMQPAESSCTCRKPKPGMILSAALALGIDVSRSILIGDKPDDIVAGRAAGVGRCFLVGAGAKNVVSDADTTFNDLAHCVDSLLGVATS